MSLDDDDGIVVVRQVADLATNFPVDEKGTMMRMPAHQSKETSGCPRARA